MPTRRKPTFGDDDDDAGAAPMSAPPRRDVTTGMNQPAPSPGSAVSAGRSATSKEGVDNLSVPPPPRRSKAPAPSLAPMTSPSDTASNSSGDKKLSPTSVAALSNSDEEIKAQARAARLTSVEEEDSRSNSSAMAGGAAAVEGVASMPSTTEDQDYDDMRAKKIAAMEGSTMSTKPGAVAVPPARGVGITSNVEDSTTSLGLPEESKPHNGEAFPGAATAVTAELVSEDKDVEAQVEERVRQETEDIADTVQRRILDQAVIADVMEPDAKDPPEPANSCNAKKWYIVGGMVLLLAVVGAVVGILLGTGGGGSDNSTSVPSLSPTPLPTPAPTPDPTNAPTLAPTGPDDLLQDRLEQEFGEILSGTPQAEAVEWIKEVDPLQLTVDTPFRLLKERYVTVVFYFATSGEEWTNDFGFLGGSSVCSWNDGGSISFGDGVFCDDSDSVTHIRMQANNLLGFLPSEITSLGSLEVLDIRTNGIKGEIPATIASLVSLETLDVAENFLIGTIPESLFELPRLETLYLFENRELGGALPATLGTIGAMGLRAMGLSDCRISGNIPASLAAIGTLEFLNLAGNSFVGAIPAFRNPSLDSLFLFDNNLSGEIPISIGELPRLRRIALSENELSGPIPHFNGSSSINFVYLQENQLTGNLEQFLSAFPASGQLTDLYVDANRLTGSVPALIGSFTGLTSLDFGPNFLSGEMPVEIGLLSRLELISFFRTGVRGVIPSEVGRLSDIRFIEFGLNEFSGLIPTEFGLFQNLELLSLRYNELTGAVPTEIATLPLLERILLQGNAFDTSLDPFFCERSSPIDEFWADCLGPFPETDCTCCSHCCSQDGVTCSEQS